MGSASNVKECTEMAETKTTAARPSEAAGDGSWQSEDEIAERRRDQISRKMGVEDAEALDFASAAAGATEAQEELGELPIIDKDELLKTDFVILNWVFNPGDFPNPDGSNRPFASIYVVTADNEKGVVNDGSTGIMAQLAGRTPYARGGRKLLAHGLKKSEFLTCPIHRKGIGNNTKWELHVLKEHPGVNVQPIESTTYYLN